MAHIKSKVTVQDLRVQYKLETGEYPDTTAEVKYDEDDNFNLKIELDKIEYLKWVENEHLNILNNGL